MTIMTVTQFSGGEVVRRQLDSMDDVATAVRELKRDGAVTILVVPMDGCVLPYILRRRANGAYERETIR